MNRKVVYALLLAALTFSVCFTAVDAASYRVTYFNGVQRVDQMWHLGTFIPVVVGVNLHGNSNSPLQQQTRLEIYTLVKNNPGVHFRGICEGLGLSVGAVQYHVDVLVHAGLVAVFLDGQNKRFDNRVFSAAEMQLISIVRHETAAKVISVLAQSGSAYHKNIAHAVGISPQALTWQMTRLKEAGLIKSERSGINVRYSIIDLPAVRNALKASGC